MRVGLVIVLATVTGAVAACGEILNTPEALKAGADYSARDTYKSLGLIATEAQVADVIQGVDRLPASVDTAQRYRCAYQTMVVADWVRRTNKKPSFKEGERFTDDDLTFKAIPDKMVLSKAAYQPGSIDERFAYENFTFHDLPSEGEAIENHAIWRAAFMRTVTVSLGITSKEADSWLRKNRSSKEADVSFRTVANAGVVDKACFDAIGAHVPGEHVDAALPRQVYAALSRLSEASTSPA